MALITCPECKNKISQYASNCVHCGWPVEEWIIYPDDIHENKEADIELDDDEEESVEDELADLIKNFTKEYAGLITKILTQREVVRLYVENDFNDENLQEKAEQKLNDKILKQTIFETQKVTEYILARLVKLNIIKDSEGEVHLTEEDQCIINTWRDNGMLLTYEKDKLGLISIASYAIMFSKEYGDKDISDLEKAIIFKTYLEVRNRKVLKQLGYSEEAIKEMLDIWKKNI